MSIKVSQVSKLYGKQKALNEVSFEINSGEIVGFLGPNGAGKSTMMKIITGFIPPTQGEVLVNGLNILDNSIEIRRQTGYLPEHNPLYLDMYVKEYLKFVAGIYKIQGNVNTRIDEIIEMTGLTIERTKKIGALSKGYRQRVGLAQAIIHDPKILILDEPTTGLDPNQIVEIRNLIQQLGKKKTVMLSTHIMQEVEAICNKVIIINQGQIVANETAKDIQNKSQLFATVLVEFNSTIDETQLLQINGVLQVKKIDTTSWLIQSKPELDIRADIFNFAVTNNIAVLSMQKKEKSLEDVFHELTQNK